MRQQPRPTIDRGDGGFVAGAETWALGVLVFVIGTLIVAWAWAGVSARSDADVIAREYIRAFTEAPDAAAALEAASNAAAAVGTAAGVSIDRVTITPPDRFARCELAEVTVRVIGPSVRLPGGELAGPEAEVTRRELVDPYRGGPDLEEDLDAPPTLCD